ncbi:MAG: hypothetical protein ACI8RA_002149, partial [Chlamydiales bacterium]
LFNCLVMTVFGFQRELLGKKHSTAKKDEL